MLTSKEGSDMDETKIEKLCRAAFLMIKGKIGEDLKTKEEFVEALQYIGFNPTIRSISKYWTDTTNQITFSQFFNIVQMEPLPTMPSLVAAFQKLDENNSGYITHEDFLLNMTTRGEMLPQGVIERLIQDEKFNQDKKFFYAKFCEVVLDTSRCLGNLALDKLKQEEEDLNFNSKTYKVKRKTSSPCKSNGTSNNASYESKYKQSDAQEQTNKWKFNAYSRGCFYLEKENTISHQYQIAVNKLTNCRITVQVESQFKSLSPLVDVQMYLFDESKRYIGRTVLSDGMCQWEGQLLAGKYLMVPHTSGAKMKRRKSSPSEDVLLISRFPKIKLTTDFQELLTEIYNKIDLDANGTLSRKEFNLFNWRTSGEEVADEEWSVVEENFPLKNGELTLDGFLTLHQMEAEDNDGDPRELKVTIQSMGYNSALVQDESVCFKVSLDTEEDASCGLSVCGLKNAGLLLDKTVTRCTIETDKKPTKVRGTNNIYIYRETAEDQVTIVYQNKSEKSVNLEMDLTKCIGCVTNRNSKVFTVTVPKKSSLIAVHILRDVQGNQWKVETATRVI